MLSGLLIAASILKDNPILLIEYIFIKKEYRNQGIATRMLKYVFDNKKSIHNTYSSYTYTYRY